MKNRALSWETRKRGDDTLVIFTGDVDESCDFSTLPPLSGKVVFDLGGIRRLNSEGVRRWVLFMRELPEVTTLTFIRCSVPVVTQLNMIKGFQGKAEVASFFAPYICEATGEEEDRLLSVTQVSDPHNPPVFSTPAGDLVLDDAPERYLAFLSGK